MCIHWYIEPVAGRPLVSMNRCNDAMANVGVTLVSVS